MTEVFESPDDRGIYYTYPDGDKATINEIVEHKVKLIEEQL